jgi:hypothetical protein
VGDDDKSLLERAALEAGKRELQRRLEGALLTPEEKAERARENQRTKQKLVVGGVLAGLALLLAVVLVARMTARLWAFGLSALVLAAVVGVAYVVVKPRVTALRARMSRGRLEREAHAQHVADEQRKLDEQRAKERYLDDQLKALKAKNGP